MRKISSASSPCSREEMSRLSLKDLPRESRLFRNLSRRNPERTSALTRSMVTFTLAQPIWVLVLEHLFMLTFLAGPRLVLMLCRDVVKNSTCNPVAPVENLVDKPATLMTFQTSTDWDTLRLSLSRR